MQDEKALILQHKLVSFMRKYLPTVKVEVRISNFKGDEEAILKIINAKTDVINHNIELKYIVLFIQPTIF
jgi:lipoate synthase